MDSKGVAVGIDLGTSNCRVAVWDSWKKDKIIIIPNDQGNLKTSNYVAFSEEDPIVGDAAESQSARNFKNTVFEVKRIISEHYHRDIVQADIKTWPFKIEQGSEDSSIIVVQSKGETKKFYPDEILAMSLKKMAEIAEAHIQKPVKDVVITVPVSFNQFQRQAIYEAGKQAGLHVIRLINETSAAAIAYTIEKKCKGEQNLLVFDLGGGFLNVAIITSEDGGLEVKAMASNPHLGGVDFDNILVKFCAEEFKKKTGIDISGNQKALRKLKTYCENAKKLLSSSISSTIEIDGLADGEDFSYLLTREKFEELCLPLLNECLPVVEKALEDAQMEKKEINEIILVGGSSRIPKLVELIKQLFDGKEPNRSINPEEAAAYGAAVQAAVLTNINSTKLQDVLLLDAISYPLGIETEGGVMTGLVPKCTIIPTKFQRIFSTAEDNQTSVMIKIFEGEKMDQGECLLLDSFVLEGIHPAPKGVPIIQINFDIHENGMIEVTAIDKESKSTKKLCLAKTRQNFIQKDVSSKGMEIAIHKTEDKKDSKHASAEKAEKKDTQDEEEKHYQHQQQQQHQHQQANKDADQTKKEGQNKAKSNFQHYITGLKTAFNKEIDLLQKWLDNNQNCEAEEYHKKQKMLEDFFNPLIQEFNKKVGNF